MFHQQSCTRLGAVAAAMTLGSAALANNVATSFEFNDLSGLFTLGTSPSSVTFSNGQAKSLGVPGLYTTGFNAWVVDAGQTGVITFETPATQVDLFFRDQQGSVSSVLTVFDTLNQIVAQFNGSALSFTPVSISAGVKAAPIARIEFVNSATAGSPFSVAVIDDFSFCAEVLPGGPLTDPIPAIIPPGDVHVQLEPLATGLTAPNWGTAAPGDSQRLFVTDQIGVLWAINTTTGAKTVFLDLQPRLVTLGVFGPNSFDERGLLGVAFHPSYQSNGLLYTYTSEPVAGAADYSTIPAGSLANHQAVVIEWHVPSPADPASVVDPTSARVLLRLDEPQFNHNAGGVNFGPDGLLYISVGDGGGADDRDGQDFFGAIIIGHGASGNGQSLSNPLGTILRIDPLGTNAANGAYGLPADNPFLTTPGAVPEIFAFGFRNPFRFSFDPLNGDLYVADVGQNDIEEIDLVSPGANYGWSFKEGAFFFDPNGNLDGFVTDVDPGVPAGLIDPIAQYDHDEGIAIIGGFVYRGVKIPALRGRYVFGDFARTFNNDGRMFYLDASSQVVEFQLNTQTALNQSVLGFGRDSAGELYLMANATGAPFGSTGVVLRIAPKQGDLNADGVTNALDLSTLIGSWDLTGVAADLNMDGVVNVFDLATLIGSWGN